MPKISPLCELYAGKYSDPWRDCMKAVADFSARRTMAASSSEKPAARRAGTGACCCRNLCGATGAATSSPRPLWRIKESKERRSRSSCDADQGKSRAPSARKDHESRSVLKMAPPATLLSGAFSGPWCLDNTLIAAFKFSNAWMLSFSMLWNSANCFSRSAVASSRAFLSAAYWASKSLMVADSSPLRAVRLSIEAWSSSMFASEALMASVFS
mmetsp:Transcript_12931/g.37170  ORF Transcript_12931/g.37170 Transcript_12931/m.37170 type:complete len:213 (-) Transcript_12931:309-947(-)